MSKAKESELTIVNDWNSGKKTPIVKYLISKGVTGTAEHIGNKQYSPTNEWRIYNKQKSYGKTDIKIGKHKISLKSLKEHVIMSASQKEVLATFHCVSDTIYGDKFPDFLDTITKEMEKLFTKGVSPLSIKKSKKSNDIIIKDAQKKHDMMRDRLEDIFDNPTFFLYFIKEMLSGELKFGKTSDGSATHILYLTDKPILHSLDDMNYIGEIAGHVDVRIDFKSVKKTQGIEKGMYRYWSVLQLISKELIRDSVLYENSIMSKSVSFILSLLSDIKLTLRTWFNLFDFLEIEPNITVTYKG